MTTEQAAYRAGVLAELMTAVLTAATSPGASTMLDGASSDLVEWCRSARNELATFAEQAPAGFSAADLAAGAAAERADGPLPADDRGAAEVLCGDRNLCARPYRHAGDHRSFAGGEW